MKFLNTSRQKFFATTTLALLLPLSALAFSGQGGKPGMCDGKDGMRGASMHGQGMKHEGMAMMRGLHRLDLSEAQQDKIFDIMHAQAPAMREQMKQLRKAEDELRELRTSADFNERKAKQLIERIANQRAEHELARLQAERKVMDVLTPEQRQKLSEMRPAKRDRNGDKA
ncbi:MAG: Spy/CpxP family protein refolding chaperone [Azonexus sp.]|jgi:Spy/CpxP family protein refolding chaperone|nr:Spy/CpxP family protein refolding chaperone [Azonexus sp.]